MGNGNLACYIPIHGVVGASHPRLLAGSVCPRASSAAFPFAARRQPRAPPAMLDAPLDAPLDSGPLCCEGHPRSAKGPGLKWIDRPRQLVRACLWANRLISNPGGETRIYRPFAPFGPACQVPLRVRCLLALRRLAGRSPSPKRTSPKSGAITAPGVDKRSRPLAGTFPLAVN